MRPRQVPNRPARVNALGNAVVPQIVELIGRAILTADLAADLAADQVGTPAANGAGRPGLDAATGTAPLGRCPRCGGYVRAPVHLLGVAARWPGGSRPFPPLRWCTPAGAVVLAFDRTPTLTSSPTSGGGR